MTGRELYERWAGLCSGAGDNTKAAWDAAEDRAAWSSLACELTTDLQAAHNDGVIECSEAVQDAWERREARRCPSTT